MPKFRHKPTEIEAIQTKNAMKYASGNWGALPKWMNEAYEKGLVLFGAKNVEVTTPHGRVTAQPEDWIVCGPGGELYPIPDGTLKASYEMLD